MSLERVPMEPRPVVRATTEHQQVGESVWIRPGTGVGGWSFNEDQLGPAVSVDVRELENRVGGEGGAGGTGFELDYTAFVGIRNTVAAGAHAAVTGPRVRARAVAEFTLRARRYRTRTG